MQTPPKTSPQTLTAQLRAATRGDHEAVDHAYGRFAIDTLAGYRDFLTAHARILPVAERLIDPASLTDNWHGRTELLFADLHLVEGVPPPELDLNLPADAAARWGALYVLEGSRLGGAVLARRLPADFPASFLQAHHQSGAWRELSGAIDRSDRGPQWQEAAVRGAKLLFGAYLRAAKLREA